MGLAEDVLDHRSNCRTIYMNRVLRFLYMDMNYHLEHHMYPMVPYHALAQLHEEIRNDCPPPYADYFRGVQGDHSDAPEAAQRPDVFHPAADCARARNRLPDAPMHAEAAAS